MSDKPVVGFIGVGLMGWGMARNAVEKGYPLRVVAHRKREAVDDLVGRGAQECADIPALARECDIIVLCVTGSPEVEEAVSGIVPAARDGLTIIDSSTSDPDVTERLAGELAGRGITLIDAPLSRTPAHAWEGELTTYVGGSEDQVARVRPLLETWASAVIAVNGPVGTAHAIKLINNLVAIGYGAVWSECYAMIRKIGASPAVFHEVVTNSGMTCGNFQNFSKYVLEGDATAHKFSLDNVLKDLTYYTRLASKHQASTLMSSGALQLLRAGNALGFGPRYLPEMSDITLILNGDEPVRGG